MKKVALLLIDIQNDYFAGGLNPLVKSEEAVKKAQLVLNIFRIKGLPVFHIQHISVRSGSSFFLPGTTGAEIHPLLTPLSSETLIIKHYPNSFRETLLLAELQEKSITSLVICGMMTHMCVDATARAARDFGFNCTVIDDACATKELQFKSKIINAESVHYSFLAALRGFYADITTAKEFCFSLDNNH